MDNVELALMPFKTAKKVSDSKKRKTSTNSFKKLYQTIMDSSIKRHKEAENRKKYRLSVIIQKLLAGILLTSDELQFLKSNAPLYYNQAMQQQRNYMKKNAGRYGIGETNETEPINII